MTRRRPIPSIDVIVVTYQSAAQVGACLEAAGRSPQVDRLIVVDNASADGSAQAARAAGASVIIENDHNAGFARAVNLGLAHAEADRVLLLNPDAVLEPPELARLSATMTEVRCAGIVAPLLRERGGRLTAGAGRLATVPRRVGLCLPLVGRASAFRPEYAVPGDPGSRSAAAPVDYVFGAAMLVEHGLLKQTGGLDERYFLFAEDEDICRQARLAGRLVLLEGRAEAAHVGGASSSDQASIEAQRLFSTWRLFEKWQGRRAAQAYHRGVLAAFALRKPAALLDAGARHDIALTGALFDEAVRTGRDPLGGSEPGAQGPSASAGTERSGA